MAQVADPAWRPEERTPFLIDSLGGGTKVAAALDVLTMRGASEVLDATLAGAYA